MATFLIYEKSKTGFYTRLFILLAVSVGMLYYYPGLKGEQGIIFLIIFIFLIILSKTEKEREPVGHVRFYDDSIQIETATNQLHFDLNTTVQIKINYGGYLRKRMIGDYMPLYNHYSGTDNSIIIKENQTYAYDFLVADEEHEVLLLDHISVWKGRHFNVLYNE